MIAKRIREEYYKSIQLSWWRESTMLSVCQFVRIVHESLLCDVSLARIYTSGALADYPLLTALRGHIGAGIPPSGMAAPYVRLLERVTRGNLFSFQLLERNFERRFKFGVPKHSELEPGLLVG